MQVTHALNAAALFPRALTSNAVTTTAGHLFNGARIPVSPSATSDSFENLLVNNFADSLSSRKLLQPSPLGEPPQVDKLGTQVRDYRNTLDAVRSDLVSQLKLADQVLKQARQGGNQDAINDAQSTIDGIRSQLKANSESLSVVHNDVKSLREIRQKLSADVAAGYTQAAAQDRQAFAQQQLQLIADLQA